MAGILRTDTIQNSNTSTLITQTNSTTITIGTSGQTIALASGASSSGFGATYNGAVNWDTTKKTSNFTAVSGNGYFVDTALGAITVTLPATPSAGDIVAIKDYANTADTNNITINRNGSNIDGGTANAIITIEGDSVTLIYVDATKGWLIVNAAQKSDLSFPTYIVATGGTILTCGDYKSHVFTGPGTFTVCSVGNPAGSTTVDYMVVAGGGGAGTSNNPCSSGAGAGGGAGGWRASSGTASGSYNAGPAPLVSPVSALPVSVQGYPITVGSGGAAAPPDTSNQGTSGNNSVFSTITSAGGGGGGTRFNPGSPVESGINGGSGGGRAGAGTAGTGNTPPVSPPQGNNGDVGGGGATQAGQPLNAGGAGAGTAITTSPTYGTPGPTPGLRYYAGGGGAGLNNSCTTNTGGVGGGGPGGRNPGGTSTPGTSGTANTGGGGGGAGAKQPGGVASGTSGAGGSGIVIIRYKFQ